MIDYNIAEVLREAKENGGTIAADKLDYQTIGELIAEKYMRDCGHPFASAAETHALMLLHRGVLALDEYEATYCKE